MLGATRMQEVMFGRRCGPCIHGDTYPYYYLVVRIDMLVFYALLIFLILCSRSEDTVSNAPHVYDCMQQQHYTSRHYNAPDLATRPSLSGALVARC